MWQLFRMNGVYFLIFPSLHGPAGTCVDSRGTDGETSVGIYIHRLEGHENNQVSQIDKDVLQQFTVHDQRLCEFLINKKGFAESFAQKELA